MGQSPKSSTYNENGKGLPFYQGKAEFGENHPIPVKWCSKPCKIAEKGDILISVRAPVGPTNICQERSCIGRGLAAISPLGGILSGYIRYWLNTRQHELEAKSTGTTFKAISGDVLRNLEINLPSLPEQKRIVAKIESLFSRLDSAKDSLLRVRQEIKRYRQAVLKSAFGGKLTVSWRRTNRTNSEWSKKSLGDVVNNYDGKRIPLSKKYRETFKGGYPYYGACGIIDHVKEYIFDGEYILIGEDGANLLSKSKPLAFIAEGKFWVNNHAHVLQAKSDILTNNFLVYQFDSMNIAEFVTGTAQPKLNQKKMNMIVVNVPSLVEQCEIVNQIESRFERAKMLEDSVEQGLIKIEQLKQSILKKAFEGKLVEPDPNDLPAPRPGKWFVYVLECDDGSYYKGFTKDIITRWKEHLNGKGAEWTKKHPPVKLIHWEEFDSEAEVVNREKELKTGFGRKWLEREIKAGRTRQAGEPVEALLGRIKREKAKILMRNG